MSEIESTPVVAQEQIDAVPMTEAAPAKEVVTKVETAEAVAEVPAAVRAFLFFIHCVLEQV